MKEFPVLEQLSDDQLIVIVFGESDEWQPEAIEYATHLLEKRNIDIDSAEIRYFELVQENEQLWQNEIKERAKKKYLGWELIAMTLLWYKSVMYDWNLKKEGYIRMYRQRLRALGVGVTMYFVGFLFVIASIKSDEKKFQQEIRQLEITDSIAIANSNWSDRYIFLDTSNNSLAKTTWIVDLQKSNTERCGILQLISSNDTFLINIIGDVKSDEIELYPDTNYTLPDGRKIARYDRLFTLQRSNNQLITYWGVLMPFNYQETNNIDLFVKK